MTWVFAYGSLMWDWQYDFEERCEATRRGYHRDFNKKSVRNWGTSDSPAPVLGLEEGGECRGVVFKLPEAESEEILASLEEREGPSYRREEEEVQLDDGRTVVASVYINKKNHTYIGDFSLEERVEMSLDSSGRDGTGEEYVRNTYENLQGAGIKDPHITKFVEMLDN